LGNTLILISCSNRKRAAIQDVSGNSINTFLDNDYLTQLKNCREELGEDFNFDVTSSKTLAYKKYDGWLYRRVTDKSWDNLKSSTDTTAIIVSAFYGLLLFDEPIINYNLSMKTKYQNQPVRKYWKDKELVAILNNFIEKRRITEIFNLLFSDYRKALNDLKGISCNITTISLPGYGHSHGTWLNNFLLNL
jgi:cytoplasmic iron level regulating protein YaaA (DUF328/UPF0246 family)